MRRRQFIKFASAGVGAALVPGAAALAASKRPDMTEVHLLANLPTEQTRVWLGEFFWANRLQDWRLHNGRL